MEIWTGVNKHIKWCIECEKLEILKNNSHEHFVLNVWMLDVDVGFGIGDFLQTFCHN